jgi:hypothetical protein
LSGIKKKGQSGLGMESGEFLDLISRGRGVNINKCVYFYVEAEVLVFMMAKTFLSIPFRSHAFLKDYVQGYSEMDIHPKCCYFTTS